MGLPGAMPVPNKTAIQKTIAAGLLIECGIPKLSKFDRKSYFYPDMPKNYQISQYDLPFCKSGKIHIGGKGFSGAPLPNKIIGVTRIHLEEDVAKSTHIGRYSGIDFNRAGVPLMEIVSEPDMRLPDEAYAYLEALKEIMQYAQISGCDMEKGQMRCDVNVSVRPEGQKELGVKIEIKNLNSLRSIHRAIEHEIERQKNVLDEGGRLEQETRGWNDDTGETFLLRKKESAHDYRYFPEPDLLPFIADDLITDEIRRSLPELPAKKRERFVADYGISEYDAQVLTSDKNLADYFDGAASKSSNPKLAANWIISEVLKEINSRGMAIKDCPVTEEHLVELVDAVHSGSITGNSGKEVLSEIFSSGKKPSEIIREKGLMQISNENEISPFVDEVIASFPSQAGEYKAGKAQALQFLIGQVMKKSKGRANPKIAAKLLAGKITRADTV
jgi:aspartyl-tRNA(Asn)/glutamyl-tRNA(Gln) amidotransferase subunit B